MRYAGTLMVVCAHLLKLRPPTSFRDGRISSFFYTKSNVLLLPSNSYLGWTRVSFSPCRLPGTIDLQI
jgi:hypothetical protein